MLLARNLAANAIGQIWGFALNIAVLPIYLSLLGAESYALVGFGLTVQVWANLIDAGMSPTFARDTARFRGGEVPTAEIRALIHSLDWICLAVLILFIGLGYATRGWWVTDWFREVSLSPRLVSDSMALIVTFSMLRWAASLYRSGIMGLERQVFANAVTTAATTVRLLVPIPLLAAWPDVRLIFATWALVALLEMALFRASLGGEFDARLPLRGFSSEALKSRARFAGGIFFLALVGLAVTQMDKLLLSRMLPLAEYGYYSLVVVIANGVLTLAMPVAQAFQPRMTLAAAQQDDPALRAVVHAFTALMVLAVITPAIVIAAFPKRLLFAWTGDFAAAGAGGDYLGWYVLGAAMAGPTSIAYLIQFAHGRIRLHMIVNLVFALVLIPAIWLAAAADGARGAAIAWFVMNATLLVIYCPAILARLLPGETARWLAELALPASAATLAAIVARTAFGDTPGWRALDFLVPAATGGAALIAAIAASPLGRSTARTLLCRARRRAPS